MAFFKKNFGKSNNNRDEYYEEVDDRYEDYDDDYEDFDDDDYYDDDRSYNQPQYSNPQEPSLTSRRGRTGGQAKVVPMPDNVRPVAPVQDRDMKMVIYKPSSYDETDSVIDSLRARKPIVVNLDEIDPKVAQRILDYISGAVYALNGYIRRAARNIFVVAPSNIEISTTGLDDDTVNGDL